MVKKKKTTKAVKKVFTLSKYDWGQHHFKENGPGHTSFAESFGPLISMVREFEGVPLGSKVEVTMKVKKA